MVLPLIRCAPSSIRGTRRAVLSTNQTLGAHIRHQHLSSPKHFKVTLDGETLYVDKELAEALGWREDGPTEGVPLRLSGWSPHYFAITQKGTDADLLAHGTVESSRNPTVIATLEYLKKSDQE